MFTKNYEYKGYVDYVLGFRQNYTRATPNYAYPGNVTEIREGVATVEIDNTLKTFMTKDYNSYGLTNNGSTGFSGVAFGDGTAEPTVDDTWLSGNRISAITSSNTTIEIIESEDGDDYCVTAVYTINNTSGADITISEVGLFSRCSIARPNSNYSCYIPVIIEHSLLESPITIPAGGVGKVNYTIRRSYATA